MTQLLFSGPFPEARRLEMTRSELSIGREDGCDLVIDDSRISRRHARVVWRLVVEDLGSTNGLWIRGHRVRLAVLEPDEPICVGGADRYFLRLDKSDIYPTPDEAALEDATVFAPSGAVDPADWDRERTARLEAEIRDLRQKLQRALDRDHGDEQSTPTSAERLRKENRFLFERVRELEARLDAAERIRHETEARLARLQGNPEDSVVEAQTRFFISDEDTDPGLDDALETETAFSQTGGPSTTGGEKAERSVAPVPSESPLRTQLAELLSGGRARSVARARLDRDLVLLVRHLYELAVEADDTTNLSQCMADAVQRGEPADWQAVHQALDELARRLTSRPEQQAAAARRWSASVLARLSPNTLRRDLDMPITGSLTESQRVELWNRFSRIFEDLDPDLLADELVESLQSSRPVNGDR